jgi:transcriptional regulator GlxA family with amidase domain
MPVHTVAIVAPDGISPFHLAVPCAVFAEDHPGGPAFRCLVCALDAGPIETTAGFSITTPYGLDALDQAQTIIVPTWPDPDRQPPGVLLDALGAAHRRGAQVVGLCLGTYVLAAAGLLDGLRATTHWAVADDFARRFPRVRLDPDVLYVDEGQVLTSAGTAAGLDCCLHLLRRMEGIEAANRVARRLVVPPHRTGGQAQFIPRPLPANSRTSGLSELIAWTRARLDQPHDLDSLAERAHMSRRTFTRHFRQMTGMSVLDWLLNERLALSQHLLETSDRSIELVAEQAGFGSAMSLRHHFRLAFGVSPTAWRRTFRGDGPT